MNRYDEATRIMTELLGRDTLLTLATADNGRPSARIVDAYYEDGIFYAVTYTLSNKMKQIADKPEVAVCGEWFNGHGVGENMGHVREDCHTAIMAKLREAFAAWYDNGHVDESDPNTCILRVRLTDGVLFTDDDKYEIDFVNRTA